MEGFGLPGLEAMACGVLVICSDIPVFHEIYKDAAIYFNPKDVKDLEGQLINRVTNRHDILPFVQQGKLLVKKYRWETMTAQTLEAFGL